MYTPWGKSDGSTQYAKGLVKYSTARHGGFWLSKERWQELTATLPGFKSFAGDGWLEEDCDWAAAAAVWPRFFTKEQCRRAFWTLRNYHTEIDPAFWTSPRGQIFTDHVGNRVTEMMSKAVIPEPWADKWDTEPS